MVDLNEQQEQRLKKADELRESGVNPYPARSGRTFTTEDALAHFARVESALDDAHDTLEMVIAGRVTSVRNMGKSIFAHVRDGFGSLQIYVRRGNLSDDQFDLFRRLIDLGDFIEARGTLFRTRTGEVSLQATSFGLLSKAINPPPEKWHGLTDTEIRYRQRYADLIANDEVRRIFLIRSAIVREMRRFLDGEGFIEVETPTLQPIYGGAAARPFTTRYHALDQEFFLRIADELYLKRLLVGGFERVFEICKDFRNEGIDGRHSPEFTMVEFYIAYADYTHVMDICERMISTIAQAALGSQTIVWNDQEIDLTPPWRRITLRQALIDATGIDFLETTDQAEMYRLAKAAGADVEPTTVWPRIVDELMKTFVRPTLIEPTFLVDYPVELSPLAKRSPDDPRLVERFQPFIGGVEMGNAYTELNDPMDQLQRFIDQARDREAGDFDAMMIDHDYVNALMYGMPPTGGFGLGIDRLTMLFTNQQNIREVILFPHLRSKSAL